MLGKMAWRNLWRHRRRTLITAATVGFGLWLAVTFTAIAEHSYTTMIDTSATMGLGHVVVQPSGYQLKPGLDKRLVGADAIRDQVAARPHVDAAVSRITGQGMFAAGARSRGGQFVGVDPARESPETLLYLASIKEGALFDKRDSKGAVIGTVMAEKLRVQLGKKVVLTTTDAEGELVNEVFRVVGIFETGLAEVDGGLVVVGIDRIGAALGYQPGDATLVATLIDNQRNARNVAADLKEQVGGEGRDVLPWNESMADLVGLIAVDRASNQIFQFLIGLLVAAGILNTILMSVLERTREFGVLMAVGMNPRRLALMVVFESVFVGVVGLIVGLIFSTPWALYLEYVGIDLTVLLGGGYSAGGVLVDPVLRFHMPPEAAVAIVTTLFSLTVLAGLYPAWRAGKVPPVESLRLI